MDLIPIINLIILLTLLGAGIHFYIQSKDWTTPIQDAKVEKLILDTNTTNVNVARIERDIGALRREGIEIQEAILKDLNLIKQDRSGIHFLKEKLLLLEHRFDNFEQSLEILKKE